MKPIWTATKIIRKNGVTVEEYVCTVCKDKILNPCYDTSALGITPTKCINQDKKHFNKPISFLREETQQG